MSKRAIKIKAGDTTWSIRLGSNHLEHDGVSHFDTREVVIYENGLTKATVYHELFHVYFNLALVRSATLTQDDLEEVAAEVMGKYAEEYYKNAQKIIKHFNITKRG